VCVCVCVCVCRASPGDAEADGAHVGQHVVEQVVASSSGLQVDVELGELQLDVVDVVEEQHQNPYVVVSEGTVGVYLSLSRPIQGEHQHCGLMWSCDIN